MGKYNRGVLGNFNGKIGTVIGATWRGIDYMRALPRRSKKAPTLKQQMQQMKFKLMGRFISGVADIVNVTFADPSDFKTAQNLAHAYNIKAAISGTFPDYEISYPDVLIANGNLHNATNPQATAEGGGIVQFSWGAGVFGAKNHATDLCRPVVYCPEWNLSITTETGAQRDAQSFDLDVSYFTGKTVETWIYFISVTGEISSSLYTGQLVVT